MNLKRLLIWLPYSLSDAISALSAVETFRSNLSGTSITILAPGFTREVLSSCSFCDEWLDLKNSTLGNLKQIKSGQFDTVVLLDNSFTSALITQLAKIPRRIGYACSKRSFLLTDPIDEIKDEKGKLLPVPMIDYYLHIPKMLAMALTTKKIELSVTSEQQQSIQEKLPELKSLQTPLIIVVLGETIEPSRKWPIDRYAELIDRLHETHQATSLLLTVQKQQEDNIADAISEQTISNPIKINQNSLNGNQFIALLSLADLIITNETATANVAAVLDRPVVSLFGPNNPTWTKSSYQKEIRIYGWASCAPCDKPVCKQTQNLCMESIKTDEVVHAATECLSAYQKQVNEE